MLYRDIFKILGLYILGFSGTLAIPLFLATYYQFWVDPTLHPQPHSSIYFLQSICICVPLGLILYAFGYKAKGIIYRREGLLVVMLIWFITPALAALPFILSGTLKSPFAAYFETASGYTTTGSTAMEPKRYDPTTGVEVPIQKTLTYGSLETTYTFFGTIEPVRDPHTHKIIHEGIEAVSKALLFWRSFTQWLGGGGIVVLFVAILPILGVGGKVLFHTEITGPLKNTLTPRIKETAMHLWKIYLGLTFFEIVLLMLTNSNMEWLDAVTITFAALSTGGFSIHTANVGYYASASTDWAVILCMLLGSLNFSLYFYIVRGQFYRIYESEFMIYLGIIIVACAFASWLLIGNDQQLLANPSATSVYSTGEAIRAATFHVVSAITTSGFVYANYDIWPFSIQVILLIVMYLGGMSGSTSGGIKTMRLYMLFRIAQHKVESLFRPETMRTFRVGDKDVDTHVVTMALCFFLVLVTVSVLGIFLFILDGNDPETSLGLVACMINCTGMTFRIGSPLYSCAFLSDFGYCLSSVLMILGRLEFFAFLALMVPAFWKKVS